MLLSIALIILVGLVGASLFGRVKLPRLLGMLLAGICLGPHMLNWLAADMLTISADIRKIALVIILLRAGLNLEIADLRRVGRPALLMCVVPACLEIMGLMLLGPWLLGISVVEAALIGTVVAAVSPAVIVPKMIHLIETGYGTKQGIPQMIMAAASVDDVFVLVLFTAVLGLTKGQALKASQLIAIPSAILLGIIGGILVGWLLAKFLPIIKAKLTIKVLVLLAVCLLVAVLEPVLEAQGVAFSGLLAIMAVGATLRWSLPELAQAIANQMGQLWFGAEIFLFVLVGSLVDLSYALKAGPLVGILIIGGLCFRTAGVRMSLWHTSFSPKQRQFIMAAYLPKATVQAAIGGIPLALGLPIGDLVLTVAVTSIIITAPLGAILIDYLYPKTLQQES